MKIKGQASVEVNYNGQNVTLPLQIVEGSGPALFGRNWLRTVKLDWGLIKKVTTDLESVISEHKEVFKDELGTLKGVKAKLYIKPGSRPKFFKPRSVPHALKNPCHVPQCIARPAAATAFLMALKLALSYIQAKSSSIV